MVKTAKNNKKSKKNYSRKIIKRKKHMKKNKTFRKKKRGINLRTKTLKYRGGENKTEKQKRLLNQRKQKINQLCNKLDVNSNDYNTLECNALTKKSNLSDDEVMSGEIDEKINSIEKKNKKTMGLSMSEKELANSNPGNREKNEIETKVEANKEISQLKSNNNEEKKSGDVDETKNEEETDDVDETKEEEKADDVDEKVNQTNKLMDDIVKQNNKIKELKIRLGAANTSDEIKTGEIQKLKDEIKSLESKLKISLKDWEQQMNEIKVAHNNEIEKIQNESNFKLIKEIEKVQKANNLAVENNKRVMNKMQDDHAKEIKKMQDSSNKPQKIKPTLPNVSGFKQDVMTEYNMSESKDGQYKILTIKMYYPNNNKSTYSSLSLTGKKESKQTTKEKVDSLRKIGEKAKQLSEVVPENTDDESKTDETMNETKTDEN